MAINHPRELWKLIRQHERVITDMVEDGVSMDIIDTLSMCNEWLGEGYEKLAGESYTNERPPGLNLDMPVFDTFAEKLVEAYERQNNSTVQGEFHSNEQ